MISRNKKKIIINDKILINWICYTIKTLNSRVIDANQPIHLLSFFYFSFAIDGLMMTKTKMNDYDKKKRKILQIA